MITENKLMELKRLASETRDKVLQAKATMAEVESNIEAKRNELKELGIKNVDAAEEEVEKMENKVQELYDKAYEKIQKWI